MALCERKRAEFRAHGSGRYTAAWGGAALAAAAPLAILWRLYEAQNFATTLRENFRCAERISPAAG